MRNIYSGETLFARRAGNYLFLIALLSALTFLSPGPAVYASPTVQDDVMTNLQTGADHIQNGRYQEAIDPLKKALASKPDASREMAAHYFLGLAYTGLSRNEEAIESYLQVIKIKPDFTNAYIGLGKVYFNLQKFEEAADTYKKVIGLDPNYAPGHFSLGAAYIGLNRPKEAIEPLKKALSLQPNLNEARYYLGIALARSGDKEAARKEQETLKSADKKLADGLLAEIENADKGGASVASDENAVRIRVGVVAIKNRSSQSVSTNLLRARLVRRLLEAGIAVTTIDTTSNEKAETEATEKGCDYILFTEVSGFLNERPLTDQGGSSSLGAGGGDVFGSSGNRADSLGTSKTEIRIKYKLMRVGTSKPVFEESILGREDRISGREDQIGLETIEKAGFTIADELRKIKPELKK
jgi:tetratricopeptide (TPR) repeat protein